MRAKPATASPVVPVSGRALWQALGFSNERAFQRARRALLVGVPLYPQPGKARGVYARSDELAAYLAQSDRPSTKRSPAP